MGKTSSLREPLGYFEIVATIQKCKFCGRTDQGACSIPFRIFDADGNDPEDRECVELGPIEQLDPDIEYYPCAWLLDDVCSAPACVEKAYAEARPLAEQIDEALRIEDAA